jgi:hypothetical protein
MRIPLVAATLALALPSAALAADARLLVPKGKGTTTSHTANVAFDLGPEWTQVRSTDNVTPRVGSYERRTQLEPGAFCVVALDATGAAEPRGGRYRHGRLHVPRPASFALQDLRVAARGTKDRLRWFRGRTGGDEVVGVAILPTPKGLAPRGLNATVVRVGLTARAEAFSATQPLTVTAEQVAACRAHLRTQAASILRTLLPTVRVQRRAAPAAPAGR